MGAAENKELIRNMFAELSKGNGPAFLDMLADDVRITTSALQNSPAPGTANRNSSIRR